MFDVIISADLNNGIGYKENIPWNFATDMKHFREITSKKIVIMGRKTWDSLPIKPLPNRFNIVVSSNWMDLDSTKKQIHTKKSNPGVHGEPYAWDWVDFVPNPRSAWKLAKDIQFHPNFHDFGIIVIGGNEVLNWFMLENLKNLGNYYLTRVCHEFLCDCFLNPDHFENLVKTEEQVFHEKNRIYPNNIIKFKFELYNKKT